MLPRRHRIRRPDQFRAVMRSGVRAAGPTLVVHLGALPSSGGSRPPAADGGAGVAAGFVVGRAVGGSVVRHQVTRRLRHLLAARLGALPPGTAVVVRALPPAAQSDSATLARDLDRSLARCVSTWGQRPVTPGTVTQ